MQARFWDQMLAGASHVPHLLAKKHLRASHMASGGVGVAISLSPLSPNGIQEVLQKTYSLDNGCFTDRTLAEELGFSLVTS